MTYLGMKLHGIESTTRAFHHGNRAGSRVCRNLKASWSSSHTVTMAHPNRLLISGRIDKNRRFSITYKCRRTIFSGISMSHLAAEFNGHDLLTIAKPQYRYAQIKDGCIHIGGVFSIYRCRTTGKNHRRRGHSCKLCRRNITGDDLRIHMQIPDAPSNKLTILRTKIENRYELARSTRRHESSLIRTPLPSKRAARV